MALTLFLVLNTLTVREKVAEKPDSPAAFAVYSWTWQANRVSIKNCAQTHLAGVRSSV